MLLHLADQEVSKIWDLKEEHLKCTPSWQDFLTKSLFGFHWELKLHYIISFKVQSPVKNICIPHTHDKNLLNNHRTWRRSMVEDHRDTERSVDSALLCWKAACFSRNSWRKLYCWREKHVIMFGYELLQEEDIEEGQRLLTDLLLDWLQTEFPPIRFSFSELKIIFTNVWQIVKIILEF